MPSPSPTAPGNPSDLNAANPQADLGKWLTNSLIVSLLPVARTLGRKLAVRYALLGGTALTTWLLAHGVATDTAGVGSALVTLALLAVDAVTSIGSYLLGVVPKPEPVEDGQ